INTPDIENYPGIAHISGFDFATGLYNQAKDLGADIRFERVTGIITEGNVKKVITSQNEYECKAVILATGAKNRPLGLPNEQELVGKGVSYCATCDGMFYRNKVVAVNGGGNTALEDAQFLSNYCEKVYVIHRRDKFRADQKEVERLKAKDNVEFVLDSTITKLNEDASGLVSLEVTNKNTGDTRTIEVSGLFVAIGQAPDNTAFENVASLDEKGYIKAGEDLKTGTEGIFTAGDCRTKTVRQLTTAASDGAVAALAACGYIDAM
nr:FAD-dependent oxidoreductase [Oribacterium sp.]